MANDTIIRAIAKSEAMQAVMRGLPIIEFTTSDATPVIVPDATVLMEDYTGGLVEYEVVAMEAGGTGKLSSRVIAGVFKDTALTIDTPLDFLHAQDTLGASFDIVDDGSDNPAVELTGVAATSIIWRIKVNSQMLLTIIPVAP
jgi:hypothetical protein